MAPVLQVTLGITFGRGDAQGMAIVRLKDGGVAQLQGGLAVGDRVFHPLPFQNSTRNLPVDGS